MSQINLNFTTRNVEKAGEKRNKTAWVKLKIK